MSAKRRYVTIHIVLSVLYIALVLLASHFVEDGAEPSPEVVFWSVLPGLVVVGWIWNMGTYLFAMEDEYLRMLETRKALVATALTLAVSGGWGLIELFTTVPRMPVFYIFPLWCLGLVVGSVVNLVATGERGGNCA